MRKNKKIKQIAEKILKLERECQEGKDVQENMAKIEKITSILSLEDMLEVDDYITKKFFDNKKNF